MVYHEIRMVNKKKQNYLIRNKRDKNTGKWVKKSKFIGTGDIKEIEKLKKEFEFELKINQKYIFLTKNQVKELEELKALYNEKMKKLEKEEFKEFEKSFFTELTFNSNAIEGNTLSLEETSLILNDNLVPEGKTVREVYEARNHKKALEFIKDYEGELNELFVLKLHNIILDNVSDRFAGRYRETSIRIFGSDLKFPDSLKVSQLMKNLFYWYDKNKKKLHPFELAIIFSMKLVTIHPFIDGNGRASRLVMNFILNRFKYPWINIYNKQRAEYLKNVRFANDEEYKPIINFLIKNLKQNLEGFGMLN